MNEPYYFKIKRNNSDNDWINKYGEKVLHKDRVYRTTRGDFMVNYLSKVDLLIEIGRGTIIEDL
jgi:hypothetical protein